MARLAQVVGRLPGPAFARLGRAIFSRSHKKLLAAARDPNATQTARLLSILHRERETEFGRTHGFERVASVEDYRKAVPIRTYDGFEPFIARMLAGEKNVLLSEEPFFYARSSGTTGAPKHIPVTPTYVREYRVPRRAWARAVTQAFPGVLRGKIFGVHSPKIEGRTPTGVPYGSITVALGGSPELGDRVDRFGVEAVPRRVFLIEDYEQRYYTALRMAAQENVSLAAAVNPSTLVLLAKKLDEHADRLAHDLEDGTLDGIERLDPVLREELTARMREAPDQAERIRASKIKRGFVLPTDVWPEIAGLVCWKGGSAPFYLAQLGKLFPGREALDYGFLATEGGFSIPLSTDGAKGVVSVLGHFLEFIPEEEMDLGKVDGARLAGELEVGRTYRVIVTASNGLYRYDINDVVQCVGHYERTAEIVFLHKGGNMISITGEKIGEAHVVEAVRRVCAAHAFGLVGFSVSAELTDPPRYVLGVELERDAPDPSLLELLARVDKALGEVNLEYRTKRDSLRLGSPVLALLQRGAYSRERARRVAAGAPDGQVKPPHLLRDPARLEALGVIRRLGP
ncbi:MAG: GH3 auxin-responsive promoter family protein [Deltaproteobacteria bacterium]|nr:GH3 auxin-responsive promoter family protein [Deltaproteobacteria bacterium]